MAKFEINEKLKKLVPYEPIQGNYKIRLDANESFINQDVLIKEQIVRDIASLPVNRYPDPYAADVCNLFADFCGVDLCNVVAGNGSDEIIQIIISAFFGRDDKIAMFYPDFSMYGFYAYMSHIETAVIPKDDNMKIDIDKACDIINTQNIKGVILSNPCSPTSIGIPSKEILRLVEKTNALVIIDEAYMEFYGDSIINKINEYENLVVLKTCSKALGLAGIRLGFALSNNRIINCIKAAKSPYNVNILTQCYAKTVLSHTDIIKNNIDMIMQRRNYLYKELKELEGGVIEKVFSTDTNFVFMKLKDAPSTFDYLKQNEIAVRLMGEHIRVTAGDEWENNSFVEVLRKMGGIV